jgi:hypothetical protein
VIPATNHPVAKHRQGNHNERYTCSMRFVISFLEAIRYSHKARRTLARFLQSRCLYLRWLPCVQSLPNNGGRNDDARSLADENKEEGMNEDMQMEISAQN